MDNNMKIAVEIKRQLGERFQIMVNARDFIAVERGLMFKFSGCKKANKIIIKLNHQDTYDISFVKVSKLNHRIVKTFENVYFDYMHEIFEDFTGLYTNL